MRCRFTAEVWLHPGEGGWAFVTLPEDVSDDLAEEAPSGPGFGAVPVRVRLGATRWSTSVFPDKGRAAYVLPMKRSVRDAEGVRIGDTVTLDLEVDASRR